MAEKQIIIYKKQENISSRKLGTDLMLYDPKADKVHILNETGVIVWELTDGKNSINNIEEAFVKQFPDSTFKTISADINEIIEKLLSEKLIIPLTLD